MCKIHRLGERIHGTERRSLVINRFANLPHQLWRPGLTALMYECNERDGLAPWVPQYEEGKGCYPKSRW